MVWMVKDGKKVAVADALVEPLTKDGYKIVGAEDKASSAPAKSTPKKVEEKAEPEAAPKPKRKPKKKATE